MQRILWAVLFMLAAGQAAAATFVVNNRFDVGTGGCTAVECTLREALTDANATVAADTINFSFAANAHGPEVLIQPSSPLPAITQSLTLNGYSVTGAAVNSSALDSNAVLRIRLDGLNAGANTTGVGVCHNAVTIKGLAITRFKQNGIGIGLTGAGANCSFTGSVSVLGNFLGLTSNGSTAAGNLGDGLVIRQGAVNVGASSVTIGTQAFPAFALADRNAIGANAGNGVALSGAASMQVFGNLIGTDKTGALDRGNLGAGVMLFSGAVGTVIGTVTAQANAPNLIRYNVIGIATTNDATISNGRWTHNRIFDNDALGIDLGNNGVTPNDIDDVDIGPNGFQNAPDLQLASRILGGVHLSGKLDVPVVGSASYTLSVYANSSCDVSGRGEGETLLGALQLIFQNGASNELINSDFLTNVSIPPGSLITMTATGPGGSSEFSGCAPVDPPPLVVNSTDDVLDNVCNAAHCSLRDAVSVANSTPSVEVIWFNIPTPATGELLIQPATPLPVISAPVTIDGYTQPGSSVNTDPEFSNAVLRVRVDGLNAGPSASGLRVCSPGVTIKGLSITRFAESGIVVGAACSAPKFTGTAVLGNFIGVAADGTSAAGNVGAGVRIAVQVEPPVPVGAVTQIGSNLVADRNVISANLQGVLSEQGGSIVLGNMIGTDRSGALDRGNSAAGVLSPGPEGRLTIGSGSAPNRIRFNGDGIQVLSGAFSAWAENQVADNDDLGVDLGNDGISPNDPDDADGGANGLQNFPILSKAERSALGIRLEGTLDVKVGTSNQPYLIGVYASAGCDPSGFGEGERLLGTATVMLSQTTGEAFSFELTTEDLLESGVQITSTATSQSIFQGNTFTDDGSSEYSPCVPATDAPPDITVNSIADPGTGLCDSFECTLREAIAQANAQPGANSIRFEIPSVGPHDILLTSLLPVITEALTIDGFSQAGSAPNAATTGSDAVLQIQLNGGGAITNLLRTCTTGLVDLRGLALVRASNAAIATQTNDAANCAAVGALIIRGNYIGLRTDGGAFSNGAGILVSNTLATIGGAALADRNIISNSTGFGVRIAGSSASGSTVQNNLIGSGEDPSLDLGNAGAGVEINGASNLIVGGNDILANSIRFNAQGVLVLGAASGNDLADNDFSNNDSLGIDLSIAAGANGVTANDPDDADSGPNNLQNFPVLTSASASANSISLNGTLDVPAATSNAAYVLTIYESPNCDASGNGEGAVRLDTRTVVLSGNAEGFALTLNIAPNSEPSVLTTTVTDPAGNSSEFSACLNEPRPDAVFANGFE